MYLTKMSQTFSSILLKIKNTFYSFIKLVFNHDIVSFKSIVINISMYVFTFLFLYTLLSD